MKTKLQFQLWLIILMISATAPGAWAQVGNLTRTGNMTVCQGSTDPFGVVPAAGSTYSWSIIAGSGGTGTIINGPTPNNLVSVFWTGAGTCTLQVTETLGTCAGIPVTIEISVLPGLMPGTASGDQTICYNTIPGQLTSTPPAGENGVYTYQWETSLDGGITWSDIDGADALSYQPGALTLTAIYQLKQTSGGGCGSVTTNPVLITVQPQVITSPIWHG